jgi:hypothetical protein
LLSARCERPCGRGAENGDELAPSHGFAPGAEKSAC